MFHIFCEKGREIMLRKITSDNVYFIKNKSFAQYAQIYTNIESETIHQIETFGLPFQRESVVYDRNTKLKNLHHAGASIRNNNKSIFINRISSACEACQTGSNSYTTYPSLKCHRNCFFCFNPNQADYLIYKNKQKDIQKELLDILAQGIELKHLALTGGEPLLFKDEVIKFFDTAHRNSPETYTRLYTTGDLLDQELLQQLKNAHLDEIRFSVKMDDPVSRINHLLQKIELSRDFIPNILVEMPVVPGTLEEMKVLLLKLDRLNIFGINLLELCFPLGNAEAFKERGLQLKYPPYEVYYNYWYAGGLAVADSEKECLELVDFALEEGLKMGVHYCSLENKHTGQVYQQNQRQCPDQTYTFSTKDYFLKTAKVFGKEIRKAKALLDQANIFYIENTSHDFIQFSVMDIHYLKNRDVEISISSVVIEENEGEQYVREVGLDWTTSSLFELEDIFEKKC